MRNRTRDLRETVYRLARPTLVYSSAVDAALTAASGIAPTRFNELFRRVRPYTMVQYRALYGLYCAVNKVTGQGIAGDVVECGVAHGGSAALLGMAIKDTGVLRRLWLFDTFTGIPLPTKDDPDYEIAAKYEGDFSPYEPVDTVLKRLGISAFVTVPGRFQDTIPQAHIPRIAVLHIDGDWHDSVRTCLEGFYDSVSPGGVVQFDDYGYWEGARKATDEFFCERGIAPNLEKVNYSTYLHVKANG